MALIVVIKKTCTGSIQSLSFQIHRDLGFFPKQISWLVCFLIIITSRSIFLPMECLLVPYPAACRGLQLQLGVYCKTELIILKHIQPSQRMLFLQCSNYLSVKVYFKRYACIIQICKILSCTRSDIFLLPEKKKEDSVSLYPCFFKIHCS